MTSPAVIALDDRRRRRLTRVLTAEALLRAAVEDASGRPEDERAPGQAWINGRAVGGHDPRHAHLYEPYD